MDLMYQVVKLQASVLYMLMMPTGATQMGGPNSLAIFSWIHLANPN